MNKRDAATSMNHDQNGFDGMPDPEPTLKNGTTKGGYARDEVASALQKCIRRNQPELALHWALEMGAASYVWRRLATIAAEDIGLADPQAIVVVNSLWGCYERAKESGAVTAAGPPRGWKRTFVHVDENLITMAILYLCQTAKGRDVDDLKNVVKGRRHAAWKPAIPDYALDMHTERGRAMGRDAAHWYAEGCMIEPAPAAPSRWEREAREVE